MSFRSLLVPLCVLIYAAYPLFIETASAQESRIWTDSSGSFSVKAVFVSADEGNVTLKKEDGLTLALKLSQLSKGDREYVAAQNQNPFAGGSATPQAAAPSPSLSLFSGRAQPVNYRESVTGGGSADITWNCAADPSPIQKLSQSPKSVSFGVGDVPFGIFPKEAGWTVYNVSGTPKALAVIRIEGKGLRSEQVVSHSRVFFGDLTTGQCKSVSFPEKLTLFGVSPDGSKAAFSTGEWGNHSDWGKRKNLFIVKIDGLSLSPLKAYVPFALDSDATQIHDLGGDITWAEWVDDALLMVMSARARLIVLNSETGEVVWQMKGIQAVSLPVMSPGKRYCLIRDSSGILLLDSAAGNAIGSLDGLPGGTLLGNNCGFSPDGKKIAAYWGDSVTLWNAMTGAVEEPFFVADGTNAPLWLNERFLLAGPKLVDTQLRAPVWSYEGAGNQTVTYGGYYWYIAKTGAGANGTLRLVGVELPHARALQGVNRTDSQRFSIRPGMKVALHIDPSVSNRQKEIRSKMEKTIQENELILEQGAPITLRLKVIREKETTTSYGVRFTMRGGTEVKYTPQKFSAEFVQGDKILWSQTHITSPPHSISLDEVKKLSLQEVVNQAMKKIDHADWFLNKVQIPKQIPNAETIGRSQLGPNGIQDQ